MKYINRIRLLSPSSSADSLTSSAKPQQVGLLNSTKFRAHSCVKKLVFIVVWIFREVAFFSRVTRRVTRPGAGLVGVHHRYLCSVKTSLCRLPTLPFSVITTEQSYRLGLPPKLFQRVSRDVCNRLLTKTGEGSLNVQTTNHVSCTLSTTGSSIHSRTRQLFASIKVNCP